MFELLDFDGFDGFGGLGGFVGFVGGFVGGGFVLYLFGYVYLVVRVKVYEKMKYFLNIKDIVID